MHEIDGRVPEGASPDDPARPVLNYPRVRVLGVPVSALSMNELLATIEHWIVNRERHYVCTLDVHALMESHSATDVQEIYRSASVVTPDGMPLVWLLRRAGYALADRICGPDLMPALFDRSQRTGGRHFLYGSTENTLARLESNLSKNYPGAKVVGTCSPPFRELLPGEQQAIVDCINAAAPDIVWVGLGAPKQDRWMGAYRSRLNAPVLIGVGAAFDMMAGTIRRAPPIIQRSGCEWLFRILQEPRRLARRYLDSNSRFALMLLHEKFHPPGGYP
jgi:N-acetylglucosaminyldiphosphoundecaprenol N-acetyl-beta-D-mannosaminyltransferase